MAIVAEAPSTRSALPTLALQPLNTNVSFRDQAYAALKQAIMDADIYAHRDEIRLDERQLSQALGVSRTPIREAMTLLEQEGFLRTVPRRGVFIIRKTKKQIVEMIEMWAALESMAARLATIHASDEDILALRHMFDEFHNATPAEHIEEYSDANIAFHQAIISLSGSHLMGKTIEIRALLGQSPRRRDLLIELLHRIQDRYGHISAAHILALAEELKLARTEVYEVATFYHHFDVVKEGETAPPALTVRICETLSCQMAGADALRHVVERASGAGVRVIGAPCIGRCEHAPAAVVGRNTVDGATAEKIAEAIARKQTEPELPAYVDYAAYRADDGYRALLACGRGERSVEAVIAAMEHSGLRGLGGAGFAVGRKWRIVCAEPAPRLMAVNIDEGEPGTFKDRCYLGRAPYRFIEGLVVVAMAGGF